MTSNLTSKLETPVFGPAPMYTGSFGGEEGDGLFNLVTSEAPDRLLICFPVTCSTSGEEVPFFKHNFRKSGHLLTSSLIMVT